MSAEQGLCELPVSGCCVLSGATGFTFPAGLECQTRDFTFTSQFEMSNHGGMDCTCLFIDQIPLVDPSALVHSLTVSRQSLKKSVGASPNSQIPVLPLDKNTTDLRMSFEQTNNLNITDTLSGCTINRGEFHRTYSLRPAVCRALGLEKP